MTIIVAGESYPEFTDKLIPICKKLAVSGTPKQAKGAIRCLYVNVYKTKNDIFDDIVEVNFVFFLHLPLISFMILFLEN